MSGNQDDADKQSVVDGLRRSLEVSGLTQAAFARALGTSASRFSTYLSGQTQPTAAFYLRADRLSRALAEAAGLFLMTPITTVRAIDRELARGGDSDLPEPLDVPETSVWALRMTLQGRDDLRAMLEDGLDAAAAWEADPGPSRSTIWDRMLAAVTAHEFEVHGRLAPRWSREKPAPPTGEPWILRNPFLSEERIRQQTPTWMRDRGLFVSERDLVTV